MRVSGLFYECERRMEDRRSEKDSARENDCSCRPVGKSSLINLLQSEVMMETGSISRKIDRGKHTTRHSELLVLEEDEKVEDCGSYIVDTPGFSSLYVNDFEKEQLKYYFPEFGPYEGLCRFSGCDHVHEPDCAVKQAAEEGKIHEIRYNDYVAMYRELQEKRRY